MELNSNSLGCEKLDSSPMETALLLDMSVEMVGLDFLLSETFLLSPKSATSRMSPRGLFRDLDFIGFGIYVYSILKNTTKTAKRIRVD